MKRKSLFLYAIIMIVILGLLQIMQSLEIKKEFIEFKMNFEEIQIGDSINGTIISKPLPKEIRRAEQCTFLVLNNGAKWDISADYNPRYSGIGIDEALEPGDYIFKRSGSDTIWVQKHYETSGYQYFFILRQIDENNNK